MRKQDQRLLRIIMDTDPCRKRFAWLEQQPSAKKAYENASRSDFRYFLCLVLLETDREDTRRKRRHYTCRECPFDTNADRCGLVLITAEGIRRRLPWRRLRKALLAYGDKHNIT